NFMPTLKTILKARVLRREETKAEKIVWEELRNKKLGIKFRRQHPFDMYVLDFYAPKIKLAIELDGSPHKEKENKEWDKDRTEYLEMKGMRVLRFWNAEVENNLKETLEKIKQEIDS
ncbi:MAG: endonuclease domain-containing protein, partial [Minisyncoccia bacterium]